MWCECVIISNRSVQSFRFTISSTKCFIFLQARLLFTIKMHISRKSCMQPATMLEFIKSKWKANNSWDCVLELVFMVLNMSSVVKQFTSLAYKIWNWNKTNVIHLICTRLRWMHRVLCTILFPLSLAVCFARIFSTFQLFSPFYLLCFRFSVIVNCCYFCVCAPFGSTSSVFSAFPFSAPFSFASSQMPKATEVPPASFVQICTVFHRTSRNASYVEGQSICGSMDIFTVKA